ncbi:hypothetical protein C0Q70_01069 [Pomacea canaliculata]|uniref:Endonuclease/exonuclease/phosphatase domain-containing protein n=1 Tax=Pomacea canaliculata TaxID=400727 RepID=A0A2T7PYF6_POMCA|nr:hypothetical protein C0Q70_01069 [Pomacea canaliculata]
MKSFVRISPSRGRSTRLSLPCVPRGVYPHQERAYRRFNSKGRKITIIQCYAPTNAAKEKEKEDFYNSLQALVDRTPIRDLKIIMGDMNARTGNDNTDKGHIMGKHGVGNCNENGELLTEFCMFRACSSRLEAWLSSKATQKAT